MSFAAFLLAEMSDEAALIAAVFAHPANQLPKLVYADWLDEHDDSLADVIRAGVEAAKPGGDHERFVRLRNEWGRKNTLLDSLNSLTRFEYNHDGQKYIVQVGAAGQLLQRSRRRGWEPVEVGALGSGDAMRAAVVALLDRMGKSYLTRGGMDNHRSNKAARLSDDVAATWADHAAYWVSLLMTSISNEIDSNHSDTQDAGDRFCWFVAHELEPLVRLIGDGSFQGDPDVFPRQVVELERSLAVRRDELGDSVSPECYRRFRAAAAAVDAAMKRHQRT